jgi:hypothetical protein
MSNRVVCQSSLLISFLACSASAEIAYSRDVAPILYQKCTACHHPNDIGVGLMWTTISLHYLPAETLK